MGAPPDLKPRAHSRGLTIPSSPGESAQTRIIPDPASPSPSSWSSPTIPRQSPSRKSPNPLLSPFPSLRILLHPTPGLGIDMRLPLSRRTRCYMQLDSFFNGPSVIRIGLHVRNYPGVRLQLSPIPRLSVRVPVHIGGAKFMHIGGWCGADSEVWKSGGGAWMGFTLELWRYTTGIGMMDDRARRGVREVLKGRDRENRLDGIPVDPRERDKVLEILKDVLRERRTVREKRSGIENGSVVGNDAKLGE